MGFWIAFLLAGAVDCGSGARLEPGRLTAPKITCKLPSDVAFPVDSCAWHAPGRLLHVVTGSRQRIYLVNCNNEPNKNCNNPQNDCMIPVRDGRTDTEHPWRFDPVSGEVYQESGRSCSGQPFRVNRERYTPGGWVLAEENLPQATPVREIQAVRGLPPGILRKSWFAAPLPDVVEPRMDLSEEVPAPVRIGDSDAQTAWVGTREGPGAMFIYVLPAHFPAVRAISIIPGHGGSGDFEAYARIRTLRIAAGTQVLRVRFPQDPARAPGALHVPWHVALDKPANCIEIAVEELYPGKRAAISEISLYTDMDAAPDPLAFFLSNAAAWPAETAARVASNFGDAQLAQLWQALAPEQKLKIAAEIARRPAASLLEAQIEMLAWSDEKTFSVLARTLARPDVREILQAKLKAVQDAGVLDRLLVPFLAIGAPSAGVLDAVLARHPNLAARVRDSVRPSDRVALAREWCAILPQRPFVVDTWARQDSAVREEAVGCLLKAPSCKKMRECMAFLRAAKMLGDPRLKSRVMREMRRPGPDAVRLQGIETLLHLQLNVQELTQIVRTNRPDEQWVLLTHWPEKAPILPEILVFARSLWPPVAREALQLLAKRCHADFPKLARPILRNPDHEEWFDMLSRVSACGYSTARRDLLELFGRRLSADAFSALAHVFAAHGEKQTAAAVEKRLQKFFAQWKSTRDLAEHASEGIRLLLALAAYERSADTAFFVRLARRSLPEPYLETLASILAARCKTPAFMPSRVWRRPAEFSTFLDACMK